MFFGTRIYGLLCSTLVLLAIHSGSLFASSQPAVQLNKSAKYEIIEWTDLIPEDDLKALLNPPDYINDILDGSPEDQLGNQTARSTSNAKEDRYEQALKSTKVRPEYNQRKVKIPGYIVPLSFDEKMVINEFFLVPFFGACIHVPPPPPNQMIYIEYKKGLTLESLYDPFFVEGTIVVKEHKTQEFGTASYSLIIDQISDYTE